MSDAREGSTGKDDGKPKSKIRRSRKGCHNCKRLKIKCDEEKPRCSYCVRTNAQCDYSMKLTWGGRPYKDALKRRKASYQNVPLVKSASEAAAQGSADAGARGLCFVVENGNPSKRGKNMSMTSLGRSASVGDEHSGMVMESNIDASGTSAVPMKRSYAHASNDGSSFTPEPTLANTMTDKDEIGFLQYNDLANKTPTPDISIAPTSLIKFEEDAEAIHVEDTSEAGYILNKETEDLKDIAGKDKDCLNSISDGIESLSNSLEKISNGSYSFNMASSEMLFNFINEVGSANDIISENNREKTQSPGSPLREIDLSDLGDRKSRKKSGEAHLGDSLIDSQIDTYTYDLMKVNLYLSDKGDQSPLLDSLSPIALSHYTRRMVKSSDHLDSGSNDSEDENNAQSLDGEYDVVEVNSLESRHRKIITPEELLKSVPYALISLPEILLQVPFYRNLMYFWVNVAADNLVPAPSYIYKDNPFKVLLPQMAMSHPAILTTLLALAASARSLLMSSVDTPKTVIDQLLARSCSELLRLLQDKKEATSDATLATVLLLSCYEACNSLSFERHRTHAHGAHQIIHARKLTFAPSYNSSESETSSPETNNKLRTSSNDSVTCTGEGNIAYFLMRWYVYIEVIGALSATRNAEKYLGNRMDIYEPIDALGDLEYSMEDFHDPNNFRKDIDYLLGFDVRLLKHFRDIILLIRQTDSHTTERYDLTTKLPISIVFKALEIKERMTRTFEKGEARRLRIINKMQKSEVNELEDNQKSRKRVDIATANILRSTNRMFFLMGVLNLYRRVLQIPRESSLVQNVANEIAKIVRDELEPGSSAEICTIFCSFCAGCETLKSQWKNLFIERFRFLSQSGNTNARKGLQIMQRCWETGEDWITASRRLDIDLALL